MRKGKNKRSTTFAALGQDYELTDREVEVLHHIATGAPNKMIAHVLNISIKTAEKHRGSVYAKLGVNNGVDAAHFALAVGIANNRFLPGFE